MKIMEVKDHFTKYEKMLGGLLVIISMAVYAVFLHYAGGGRIALGGDETYYFATSKWLKAVIDNFFLGNYGMVAAKWNAVIGRGMFIPSTSLLGMPMHYFSANLADHRIYLFVVNLILHCILLYMLWKQFGFKIMAFFHLITLCIPIYSMFSLTYWGEPVSSRMIMIMFLFLLKFFRGKDKSVVLLPIFLGFLLAIVVYFRNSMIVLCPVVILFYALKFFLIENDLRLLPQKIKHFVASSALTTFVFCALFLPWSYALSKKFGGLYLTTTTIDSVYLERFGSKELFDRVKKNGTPNVVHIHNYFEDQAKETGESYASLIKAEVNTLRQSPGMLDKYKTIMRRNISRSVLEGVGFLRRIKSGSDDKIGITPKRNRFYQSIYSLNSYVWYTLLIGGAISLCLFFVTSWELIILKWIVFFASIQIMFVGGSARHPIILIPILTLLILLQLSHIYNFKSFRSTKFMKVLSLLPILFYGLVWLFYTI